jgi:hypothetical protein
VGNYFFEYLKASIADLNSEGGGDSGNSCADPCQNLKKVFWGFLVVSPLFNHLLGNI